MVCTYDTDKIISESDNEIKFKKMNILNALLFFIMLMNKLCKLNVFKYLKFITGLWYFSIIVKKYNF